jgi:hypothetical protein
MHQRARKGILVEPLAGVRRRVRHVGGEDFEAAVSAAVREAPDAVRAE